MEYIQRADNKSMLPIHYAVLKGNTYIVELLIRFERDKITRDIIKKAVEDITEEDLNDNKAEIDEKLAHMVNYP